MRLRPYGDSGPLVCNLDFLETYFVTQGREWERYAWIKARVLTGEQRAPRGARASVVRPFVFRSTSTTARSRRCASCTRRCAATWRAASSPTT